ncbi:MAG: hypothetical protein R6X02_07175 [Enhygromyxa sp.]
MTGLRRERVLTAITIVILLAIVAGSAWLREPGFSQGGFASHDVAGILYNAMVLERGGLPYVDTLELKAPGSFYLARWLAGPQGRDIASLQVAANLWALAALIGVAGIGWRLWGRLGAIAAAGLYALHDAHLDTMDANYVTWANLPQIVGFGLALEAARSSASRWRPSLWLCAGAAAGFAALCKQPAGAVLLAILAMAAWPGVARNDGRRFARWIAPAWVVAGFGLAHAPIVLQYLAAGELRALIDGYFLNRWGLRYLGAREVGLGASLLDGGLATAHFVGLPLVLASFTLGAAITSRGPQRRAIAWLAIWLASTLLAASLGFRFYKGYFLTTAAPFCLLAAAPIGLLGARCRAHWAARALGLAIAALLIGRQALVLDHTRRDRAQSRDHNARRIAAHLVANTGPDDTIWVWGWHLWDVYPLSDRMAGSRIYKSLGILSQPNDDTWRRPATPLRFVDSEYAAMLIADFEANRPAYVVLGSTVPHREFEQLHRFLRAHYRRDYRLRINAVQFWRLRERPITGPPRSAAHPG